LDDCVADETRRISRIDSSCVSKVNPCAAEEVDVAIILSMRCDSPACVRVSYCACTQPWLIYVRMLLSKEVTSVTPERKGLSRRGQRRMQMGAAHTDKRPVKNGSVDIEAEAKAGHVADPVSGMHVAVCAMTVGMIIVDARTVSRAQVVEVGCGLLLRLRRCDMIC